MKPVFDGQMKKAHGIDDDRNLIDGLIKRKKTVGVSKAPVNGILAVLRTAMGWDWLDKAPVIKLLPGTETPDPMAHTGRSQPSSPGAANAPGRPGKSPSSHRPSPATHP